MTLDLTRLYSSAQKVWPILLLSVLHHGAAAQENSGDGSTVIYPADYFVEYSPTTAQNMLDRIPGQGSAGSSRGGPPGSRGGASSGGRGLGSGSGGNEILVNGKRTAGKNNQTSGLLERISAAQVKEIQIIRGTSGELDVRGSDQVVNVVLFEELSSTSMSYEVGAQQYDDGNIEPQLSAALSGQFGNLNYVISASSSPNYNHSIAEEDSVLGDFSLNDLVREERIRQQDNDEISINLGYDFSASSSLRFNALYAVNDAPTDVNRYTTNLRTDPYSFGIEREEIPNQRDNWEIGADYEFRSESGNRFKLLAITNQENRDTTRERFRLLGDGSPEKNLFLQSASVTEEQIVRGSYTMDIFGDQDIEFGLERAQTTLESSLALGLLSSTGVPSAAVGGLVPQAVSNANSTVEELRYEPFIIHNWVINPKMSLESTLLYETSEITQSGDVSNKRNFDFVKPKFDLRYDVTPSLQLRGTIEKEVMQLSFSDFVAANDDEDNDTTTQAGNAQLRQQWSWKYNFRTEYRLPNDVGVVSSDLFYFDHRDVIDRLDVTTNEANLQSANGNIGDGNEYGVNLNASVRMGMINLPDVLVTSSLNLQDSNITDPFLGIERRLQFHQRGRFTFTFRHDITHWRMNWGMQYFDRVDGGMFRYDIDDIEFTVGQPRVNLFAEYIDTRNVNYRFDFGGITDGAQCRRRSRFVGRIAANILEEIEYQCTRSGPTMSFKVNGTF